ncbi:MAG: substrate-binding domain-containing protein [Bacteroidia bacterium]|nr:substrate-binding domain-containing protein [Bacteroidia bacterium]
MQKPVVIPHYFPFLLALWAFLGLACTSERREAGDTATDRLFLGDRTDESATNGHIRILADEALQPIVAAEVDNFQAVYPEAHLEVVYLPGEAAVQRLIDSDSFRLVITARMLSTEEDRYLRSRYLVPQISAIALDGIVLLVHPAQGDTALTLAQVQGILQGSLTRWEQVSARTRGPIQLVFDDPLSGVARYLQDSLLAGQPLRTQGVYAAGNSPKVFDYVAATPGSLGIVSSAWISDRDDPAVRERLRQTSVLKLSRDTAAAECRYLDEYVGHYQSFLLQACYPLTRKVYTILREPVLGLGTGFVAYLDGPQGQLIIHKSGLGTIHTIPRKIKLPPLPKGKQTPP